MYDVAMQLIRVSPLMVSLIHQNPLEMQKAQKREHVNEMTKGLYTIDFFKTPSYMLALKLQDRLIDCSI